MKAIRAGKHVLLEKPSVANAIEAQVLFNLPELSQPNAPVLLEGYHSQFLPSWALIRSLIEPQDVIYASSNAVLPWWLVGKESSAFSYDLAGGNIISLGTYNLCALRLLFGSEPEECIECETKGYTDGIHDKCDWEFRAKFRFPNGAIGEASSSMKGGTILKPSSVTTITWEVVIFDETLPTFQERVQTREVTLWGLIHGTIWHRIDVTDNFIIRDRRDQRVIRKWQEKSSRKAYTFQEAGGEFVDLPGEPYWLSFRHQLEQFVNRVKGRRTVHWISGEDSVAQMRMIDMVYEKSGLGPRPTSAYVEAVKS